MTLKEALEMVMADRYYFCRKKEGRNIFADMIADIGGLEQLEERIRSCQQILVLIKRDAEVYRRTIETLKRLLSSEETMMNWDDILSIVICSDKEWTVGDRELVDKVWHP